MHLKLSVMNWLRNKYFRKTKRLITSKGKLKPRIQKRYDRIVTNTGINDRQASI